MKDFLITLCLGWLGVHRFAKRKYITGAIWFFTLGLFGIGWAVDVLAAFLRLLSKEQKLTQVSKIGKEQSSNKALSSIDLNDDTVKIFSKEQIEAMTKADIFKMATGLGYAMEASRNDTKEKIVSEFMEQQKKHPSTNNQKWLIKTFNTETVGTFAKCDLDTKQDRADIICSLNSSSKLYLKYWEYKNSPAFYICCKGIDIGCVPATISKKIYETYKDCEFAVTRRGEALHNHYGDWIQKITIEVYK